jgi:hypothetical protein
VTREGVDGVFVDSLASDKHIVVFGSSKQGKTSLRKHSLEDEDYVVVTCSNRWTGLAALHAAVLKAAGYVVEQSSTKTAAGSYKVTAKLEGKAGVPFVAHAKAATEGSYKRATESAVTFVPLDLDPADVNDIITALGAIEFKKIIVLEDFHYLPDETQRDFAVALKAFHEHSNLTFIVVGVWLDENRLIQFNGDLTERVIAVNVDAWSPTQLECVIKEGEALLNIVFDEYFKQSLIRSCFESVSVVQVTCHAVCKAAKIFATQRARTTVGSGIDARQAVRAVVDKQSARYNSFLHNFAGGFQETQLEMYRWLLLPVLMAKPSELEKGLSYGHIGRTISAYHPTGKVNAGNITQALQSTASLQVKLGIKPIVLDYDQSTRRLNVVDRGFLIWLGNQNQRELLLEAQLPDSPQLAASVPE